MENGSQCKKYMIKYMQKLCMAQGCSRKALGEDSRKSLPCGKRRERREEVWG